MNLYESWAKAKPFLEPAIEALHGTHTIDDVCLMVGSGALRIVNGEKSALLIEENHHPHHKDLHVFLGGGDLEELLKLEAKLSEGAKASGFRGISGMSARDGWLKALPGYEQRSALFYKEL